MKNLSQQFQSTAIAACFRMTVGEFGKTGMVKRQSWQLIDVDDLAQTHADFFCHYPVRSMAERQSVFEGELVKIVVRVPSASGA